MSPKRIMILGGSILQYEALKEAKMMGHEVAVVDFNPLCMAREFADTFFLVSTHDEKAVLEAAREYKPHGIITLCTDWPQRSVSYASEALGLTAISYEAAVIATDKRKSIERFKACSLAHPFFYVINDGSEIPKNQTYPLIVKPVDSSGSRGVSFIKDEGQLKKALHYALEHSKGSTALIEEFMEGPEISVEVLVIDGTPHVLAITDKRTTGFPHFVETMHVQPALLEEHLKNQVISLSVDACKCLNLTTGAAHVEMILTSSGPKLVEVGPRMGGDFISTHLVKLSTGINMTELLIREALGESITLPEPKAKASVIKYITPPEGIFRGTPNIDEIKAYPGVVDVHIEKKIGETLSPLKSSVDRLGHILVQASTREEAILFAETAMKDLQINMELLCNHSLL